MHVIKLENPKRQYYWFFTMDKMVISSKYIIWKFFLRCPFSPDTLNSYISFLILQQYHFTFPIILLYYPYDL
jgi:hypothetical protein